MIPSHAVDVRAVTNTVAGVTTIIGVVDYSGTPSRTFYHGIQVQDGASAGIIATTERRAISVALDQFVLWVQNGKPQG